MDKFALTITANIIISLFSLVGVATLSIGRERLNRLLIFLVAASAGTLLGGAFLHLIPEASAQLPSNVVNLLVLGAFIVFFLLEKILRWHHHHDVVDDKHVLGLMNLTGDVVHNFLDGLVIAAAFYTNINLGIATSVAVVLHEIPHEIGNFCVLLHSGFSVRKAVLSNLFVALFAILGGFIGFLWVSHVGLVAPYITAFAAGGFIYIATSDLLPEIRQETNVVRSWLSFVCFLLGVVLMFVL